MLRRILGVALSILFYCGAYASADEDLKNFMLTNKELSEIANQEEVIAYLQKDDVLGACQYIRGKIYEHSKILPNQKYEVERIGNNLLSLAAFLGHENVVRLLLERGVPADESSYFGTTPLMYAIAYGNVAIVALLLAYGADISAINRYGESVQDYVQTYPAEGMQALCAMYSNGA